MLEIECTNVECGCECMIAQSNHMNLIFPIDLKLNKVFTCDDCDEVILVVDEVLLKEVL